MKRKAMMSFPVESLQFINDNGVKLQVTSVYYNPAREMVSFIVVSVYEEELTLPEVPPGQELPGISLLAETHGFRLVINDE